MTRDELLAAYAEGRRDFIGANLWGAHLEGVHLEGANLAHADLWGAHLAGAHLAHADLCGAHLAVAHLAHADLRSARLAGAHLEGVNLEGVNLADVDLTGADLTGANLWGVIGNMREIKSMHLYGWPVAYTFDRLQIGCKNHSLEKWRGFGDESVAKMDAKALDWWRKWKDHLFKTIELSPATPTGHEVGS